MLDTTDPVHPSFMVDVVGTYVVQLIVNDGTVDSGPNTVNTRWVHLQRPLQIAVGKAVAVSAL